MDENGGRDGVGRFAPGHGGGPGRPRGQTASAELRRQGDPERIAARLLQIIDAPETSTKDRLVAITLYFDRTEGKALATSLTARVEPEKLLPENWSSLPLEAKRRYLDSIEVKPAPALKAGR